LPGVELLTWNVRGLLDGHWHFDLAVELISYRVRHRSLHRFIVMVRHVVFMAVMHFITNVITT
jgi:membrane protein required for beta-lactamase induction